MVMGIHNTCVKVKNYLTNLKELIGNGTKTLFGYKREVTPDAVAQVSLTGPMRVIEQRPGVADTAKKIQEDVNSVVKKELIGGYGDNRWVYYGEQENGKAKGKGIRIYSDGEIQRGHFQDDLNGAGEMISPRTGARYVGEYSSGQRSGSGVLLKSNNVIIDAIWRNDDPEKGVQINSNNTRFEGTFSSDGGPLNGKRYKSDGTLHEEGLFEKSVLTVGKKYDSTGQVAEEVNLPRDRELAAANAIAVEQKRKREAEIARQEAEMARQSAEQRKKDDALAAEVAYRNSLNTMNAGQLFAGADEFLARDKTKAREMLRILVSRFPDHPLAAAAAQQMATMSAASAGSANAAANNNSNTGAPASSGGSAGGSKAGLQLSCNDSLEPYLSSLPNFSASVLRGVVSSLRSESAKHLSSAKAGRLNLSQISGYQQQLQEYKNSGRQALENHRSLTAGPLNAAVCNPADGSQASAWAATQLGVAFNTWVINVIRCTAGQTALEPLPAFCPY